MEVPRLGGESELQLPANAEPQHHQIRALSATYTIAQGNTRSFTHSVGPGIKPTSSWILVEFVTTEPQWELLFFFFLFWPHLQHMEVPRTETEFELQQEIFFFFSRKALCNSNSYRNTENNINHFIILKYMNKNNGNNKGEKIQITLRNFHHQKQKALIVGS